MKTVKTKRRKIKKASCRELCSRYTGAIQAGTLLAIDPSSGKARGTSSLGYALYSSSELIESGRVYFESSPEVAQRLQSLKHSLEMLLPHPQVLAIEHVMLGRLHNGALIAAWGAIVATVPAAIVIPVPPQSWRQFMPENYEKNDVNDAILIGKCVIEYSKEKTKE